MLKPTSRNGEPFSRRPVPARTTLPVVDRGGGADDLLSDGAGTGCGDVGAGVAGALEADDDGDGALEVADGLEADHDGDADGVEAGDDGDGELEVAAGLDADDAELEVADALGCRCRFQLRRQDSSVRLTAPPRRNRAAAPSPAAAPPARNKCRRLSPPSLPCSSLFLPARCFPKAPSLGVILLYALSTLTGINYEL